MKISVLIPAYNVENYISQCLESVCGQTYRDLQIIVIDDGSKDSTFSIISKYAEKDARIEATSRENKGVATTRNELLDKATGDFVLFVDSDDWIEHDMISTLVGVVKKCSVDLVMCKNISGDAEGNNGNENIRIWEKNTILNKFLEHRELTGSLWNKLIRREQFDGIRFKPGIGYGEDAMVMWNILNKINKIAFINRALYHYRLNDNSISHQGLSESKMSVLQVWDYISCSDFVTKNKLTQKAKARFGAEITLLLLSSIGNEFTEPQKNRIRILRNKLRELYPYLLRSGDLSYKFKSFAALALLNWPFLNYIVRKLRITRVGA